MFNEQDRELCHRVHQYNMGQQQVGSSPHMDPNRRQDQPQKGTNHLLDSNHHLLVGTFDKVISSHSIHFTEGGCSNTSKFVSPLDN